MAQGDTLGVVMQSDIGSGASGGVAAQAQISDMFSATAVYAVGAYVVYNGLLYRCTTAHSGAWNAAHFEQVTIGGELNTRTPVYGGGVNLLDNWYFIGGGSQQGGGQYPINQRGNTVFTTAADYTPGIDRWYVRNNGGSGGYTVGSGGLIVPADNSYHGFSQVIATKGNYAKLAGRTVTFSVFFVPGSTITGTVQMNIGRSNTAGAVGTSIAYKYVTQSSGLESVTGELPNTLSENYLNVVILGRENTNASFSVAAVKLELGDTQTLARNVGTEENPQWVLNDPPPNFQQELAKCQRYFQVFRDQNLRPAYGMDYRPPMAKEQPTQSSFVFDGVTYYTASAEL